jgi:hypothetical protein
MLTIYLGIKITAKETKAYPKMLKIKRLRINTPTSIPPD